MAADTHGDHIKFQSPGCGTMEPSNLWGLRVKITLVLNRQNVQNEAVKSDFVEVVDLIVLQDVFILYCCVFVQFLVRGIRKASVHFQASK